jgi:hypothetical protein
MSTRFKHSPADLANFCCIGGVMVNGLISGDALKVIKAQLDANGFADIAFALANQRPLVGTERVKISAQCLTVTHRVQIVFERGFAAHADTGSLSVLDWAVVRHHAAASYSHAP